MTKKEQQRTLIQNNALHKYFELVANSLNDGGFDVQAVIKHQMDISWSPVMVKELIWKAAQKVHCDKRSTTELTTDEVNKVYLEVNRYLAEKYGITEPFPSLESLMLNNELN